MNKRNKYIGCIYLTCNVRNYENIVKGIVDQDDLYDQPGFGYSKYPHITLLYGLDSTKTKPSQIGKYLYSIDQLYLYTKRIDYFEDKQYDVVKFNIKSKSLKLMNSRLKNNFNYQNDYPIYQSHMTIAYVKSGLGKKYVKPLEKKYRIRGLQYIYNVQGYRDHVIKLQQKKR